MRKQERCKNLYKCVFSYSHEIEIGFIHAYTKHQAWFAFCHRLAKKHQVSISTVTALFDGTKDNYQISIEVEMIEEMEGKDEKE